MRIDRGARLLVGISLLAAMPAVADPFLCSPSLLVGRLTTGATNPRDAVRTCGCTDSVAGAVRALGMPLPAGCDARDAASAPSPPQAETSRVRAAPPDSGEGAVATVIPADPEPVRGPICCDIAILRDGVELLHERVCDARCTSSATPEVVFP